MTIGYDTLAYLRHQGHICLHIYNFYFNLNQKQLRYIEVTFRSLLS
ncbi:protein of unknown function [Vibrio tapetis subsp. tapetis]|uniref:Uncharacterized protein n=1 Tax=Vibrio tapetis subsp. tapetis TaxID=1671868 RepID=A0A2N8ZLG6_9VIBR|nr:protein of unknown function [Vibrio tapetis subsp. tapetis]